MLHVLYQILSLKQHPQSSWMEEAEREDWFFFFFSRLLSPNLPAWYTRNLAGWGGGGGCFSFWLFCFVLFLISLLFFRAIRAVPRLGVRLQLQLLGYTTATATPHLSRLCHLYHSSGRHRILNPLNGTRDQTCVLIDARKVHFH